MNDDTQHRLQQLAESNVAIAGSRLVTPALLLITIGLVSWIGVGFSTQLAQQGRDIAEVKTDVRVLGTRLDAQVIRQVDHNTKRVDRLEDRVEVLERSVPTP